MGEREREIEEALRARRATISLRASNFYDGGTGPGRANTRGDQPLSTTFHRLANVRCAHIPLESGSLRRRRNGRRSSKNGRNKMDTFGLHLC